MAGNAASADANEGWVGLRAGQMGRYLWFSAAELPESESEREAGQICLEISMVEPAASGRAEGQSVASCGAPPQEGPTIEHLSSGNGDAGRTVFAVLLPPQVQRVQMKLRGEPRRTLRAGHASLPAPREGRISFAFVSLGVVGPACLEGVEGWDAEGTVVSTLGRQACH
jgi:hypothetical protein